MFGGLLIGVGRQYLPMDQVLILRAIGAPLGFAVAAVVLLLDLFLVAPLFEHSYRMFTSVIGVRNPPVGIWRLGRHKVAC
jgi:hypothetical protein